MLRLVKKFDLLRDIYDRIPDEKLQFPKGKLTMESSRLAIVGHERTGHILVSYDGIDPSRVEKVTFIDIYDPNSKHLKCIYKHDAPITCVGATISETHTLLAFTMLVQTVSRSASGGREREFHTLVVELREGGKYYKMKIRKSAVQRVQFLYIRKPGMFYLLFFFDKLFVHLYQIPTKQKRHSGVEITAHPNLVRVIAKHFIWCEWDIHRNYLYVLQKINREHPRDSMDSPVKQTNSLGGKVSRCLLKCLFIPDKTYDEVWEIPLKMTLVHELPAACAPKFYYGLDHRAQAPAARFFHVVRLAGHPTVDELTSSIKVTLYVLHDNSRLDINIPMNNFDYAKIASTRVLFTPIGNMVLIYIPEIYIQLVDCGYNHPPYPGLVFSGPELATKLPLRKRSQSDSNSSFVTNFPTVADPGEMGGHCLLDTTRGICYEYLVDRSAILDIFATRPDYLHVPALHLAIVHMQDKELVDEILHLVCTEYPYNISPLLREFLVAAPYLKAKRLAEISPQLLNVVPLTSLPSLASKKLNHRLELVLSELKGYYVFPSPNRLIVRDTEQPKVIPRYQHGAPLFYNPEARYIDLSVTTQTPSRFGSFFRNILNISNPQNELGRILSSMNIQEDRESSLSTGFTQLIHGFSAYLTSIFKTTPHEKIIQMTQEYRYIVVDQTNLLFNTISQSTGIEDTLGKGEALVLYQVMECFYCALEELSYPCPQGFSHSFVNLGKQCLPRSVFLQYIERGVFSLNVLFVETVLKDLTDSEDDKLFKYELLSHLKKREKSLEIMQSHNEYVDYLLQYHLGKFPVESLSRINLQSTNNASFIPRTVFLNAIRDQYDIGVPEHGAIMSLIEAHDQRLLTHVIHSSKVSIEAEPVAE